jgi:hypothetical protein
VFVDAAAASGIAVVFAMVHTVLSDFFSLPFTPIALAALWVTPLAALLIRPSAAAHWVRDAVGHDAPTGDVFARALPSLRRVLIPGLVAGVACWVAVIGVRTYIHSLPTPVPQQHDHEQIYRRSATPITVRTRAQATALLEPGVVYMPLWRPDPDDQTPERPERYSGDAAVGRLP